MQATAVAVPVQDTGDALKASLTGALNTFFVAIPRIIGFAVVLIVGWIISSLLASAVLAGIVKWLVRLITLVVAFDTLGLPAVSNVLQQLLLWLPNLVVALVVLVIGGLAANALSQLVRGATSQAGFSNPDTLATVTKVAVWGFAIVVAVNQLGIATTLINTLLIGIIGALSIAFGLAFGLGGRDHAAQILDTVHRNAQGAGPKLQRAASAASRNVQDMSQQMPGSSTNGSWIERSAQDRRRVNRPGMQDRRGNGSQL